MGFMREMNEHATPRENPTRIRRGSFKKTMTIGFDNILHDYDGHWHGPTVINGSTVEGSEEWLRQVLRKFNVSVYCPRSSTLEGRLAMKNWVTVNYPGDIANRLAFPEHTPPAWVEMHYRTIQFDGHFPEVEELVNFVPASQNFQKARNQEKLLAAQADLELAQQSLREAQERYTEISKKYSLKK